jgi:hypothetical protein
MHDTTYDTSIMASLNNVEREKDYAAPRSCGQLSLPGIKSMWMGAESSIRRATRRRCCVLGLPSPTLDISASVVAICFKAIHLFKKITNN